MQKIKCILIMLLVFGFLIPNGFARRPCLPGMRPRAVSVVKCQKKSFRKVTYEKRCRKVWVNKTKNVRKCKTVYVRRVRPVKVCRHGHHCKWVRRMTKMPKLVCRHYRKTYRVPKRECSLVPHYSTKHKRVCKNVTRIKCVRVR